MKNTMNSKIFKPKKDEHKENCKENKNWADLTFDQENLVIMQKSMKKRIINLNE
jgi:hypothetical protein